MPLTWAEPDLDRLIGQEETVRRDFKSGRLFDKQESGWVEDLTIEVSALANTEGGELFLGIDEDRRKRPRVAMQIDGVPTSIVPERLQQLIEGNMSPYLPGIRFQRVMLTARVDRVVFVIQVPQGTTAYQAKDGRYYGRSNYEAKFLPDHEIRLRMNRGKIAKANIRIDNLRIKLGAKKLEEYKTENRELLAKASAGAEDAQVRALADYETYPDMISFELVLKNEGEVTIREPVIQIREEIDEALNGAFTDRTALDRHSVLKDAVIYPGDEMRIPNSSKSLGIKQDIPLKPNALVFHWKVFLDNSVPSDGMIDLGNITQEYRIANRTA